MNKEMNGATSDSDFTSKSHNRIQTTVHRACISRCFENMTGSRLGIGERISYVFVEIYDKHEYGIDVRTHLDCPDDDQERRYAFYATPKKICSAFEEMIGADAPNGKILQVAFIDEQEGDEFCVTARYVDPYDE